MRTKVVGEAVGVVETAGQASDLLAGRFDAYLAMLGAPTPAIATIEANEPVTFIRLSPQEIDSVRKAMPEFSPSKIAAGTYRFLEKDSVTVGVYNFAIGRPDLPDDLVAAEGVGGDQRFLWLRFQHHCTRWPTAVNYPDSGQ